MLLLYLLFDADGRAIFPQSLPANCLFSPMPTTLAALTKASDPWFSLGFLTICQQIAEP